MEKVNATEPLVHIIVITHNGKTYLEECLPSLQATAYSNYQAILVDNASTNGTYEFVRDNYPEIRIIHNLENYGFAKGNNIAMRQAIQENAEYVMLLNDDTMILDPSWLSQAVQVAEADPYVSMVGFNITDDINKKSPTEFKTKDVIRISGCALLIQTKALDYLGLFDEVYFAYGEESDLEVRALKAGFKLKQISIPLYHRGGGSFSKMQRRFTFLYLRNWMRFSIKNESILIALLRPFIIFDLFCNPFPIRRREADRKISNRLDAGHFVLNVSIWLEAILWNLFFLPQTLAIRARDCAAIRATRQMFLKETKSQS